MPSIKTLLCLIFFSGLAQAEVIDRLLAVVGDQPILKSDIVSFRSDLKQNPHLASTYDLKKDEASDEKLVELLIDQSLIKHVLKDNKLEIRDDDVIKQVAQIAAQNNMTLDQLKVSLKRESINYHSYLNSIRLQLEKRAIFDSEIRHSANASPSEEELRAEFMKNVQSEWNLVLFIKKNSAENQKALQNIVNNINSASLSLENLKKEESPEMLGWVSPSTLQKRFQDALQGKKDGEAVGPILSGGSLHVLVIENSRRGSEEQFQATKDELIRRRQSNQVDALFKSWFDKKRSEIELVINK